MSKHLTSDRIGFNPMGVAYSTIMLVNLIVLIPSIIYWVYYGFDSILFWIGLVGNFADAIGIAMLTKAISNGPIGLIAALATTTNLFLTLIEAIKH